MFDNNFPDPDCLSHILAAAGSDTFGAVLLKQAQAVGPISEVFLFRRRESAPPSLIAVAGESEGAKSRAQSYVERYFHHDPMLHQHRNTIAQTGFTQDYRIGLIAPREYQQRCFVDPGFVAKYSNGWRWPNELLIVSFYTSKPDQIDRAALLPLASISLAAAHNRGANSNNEVSSEWLTECMHSRFPSFSARERLVCQETLLGKSSDEIARDLQISPTSVLTYRRRAYQKAGISTAGQALAMILNRPT